MDTSKIIVELLLKNSNISSCEYEEIDETLIRKDILSEERAGFFKEMSPQGKLDLLLDSVPSYLEESYRRFLGLVSHLDYVIGYSRKDIYSLVTLPVDKDDWLNVPSLLDVYTDSMVCNSLSSKHLFGNQWGFLGLPAREQLALFPDVEVTFNMESLYKDFWSPFMNTGEFDSVLFLLKRLREFPECWYMD